MKTHFETCSIPRPRLRRWSAAAAAAITVSCAGSPPQPRAPYVPIKELEAHYGRLITAANHPTPQQHGTGDRLGLFRDRTGTVWGLPLSVGENGIVLGCAPTTLEAAPVTDMLPAGVAEIVGATNAPTGWRGGTGKLELVFRDLSGELRWRAVASGELRTGPVCMAQEPPGPQQYLEYYRLAPPPAR